MITPKEEFGKRDAEQMLQNQANKIRTRLGDISHTDFDSESIELNESGQRNALLDMYESGHVIGRAYFSGAMPTDRELLADLDQIGYICEVCGFNYELFLW
ncbi:MAG: MrcB family domain-containing protein [Anaerolineae bacterium]